MAHYVPRIARLGSWVIAKTNWYNSVKELVDDLALAGNAIE